MNGFTPKRGVRISDAEWNAAKAKAVEEGTTVSERVRQFLEQWANEHSLDKEESK